MIYLDTSLQSFAIATNWPFAQAMRCAASGGGIARRAFAGHAECGDGEGSSCGWGASGGIGALDIARVRLQT